MDCDRIATMQDIVRAFRHRRRCSPLLAANLTELSRALAEQHRWSEAFEASDDGRDLYYALFQQQPRAFLRPLIDAVFWRWTLQDLFKAACPGAYLSAGYPKNWSSPATPSAAKIWTPTSPCFYTSAGRPQLMQVETYTHDKVTIDGQLHVISRQTGTETGTLTRLEALLFVALGAFILLMTLGLSLWMIWP